MMALLMSIYVTSIIIFGLDAVYLIWMLRFFLYDFEGSGGSRVIRVFLIWKSNICSILRINVFGGVVLMMFLVHVFDYVHSI